MNFELTKISTRNNRKKKKEIRSINTVLNINEFITIFKKIIEIRLVLINELKEDLREAEVTTKQQQKGNRKS